MISIHTFRCSILFAVNSPCPSDDVDFEREKGGAAFAMPTTVQVFRRCPKVTLLFLFFALANAANMGN